MAGLPVFTVGLLTSGIPFFVSEFELGRALGLTVALTLVAVVVARAASRPGMVGFAAVVARTAVVCAARVPEHARHQVRVEYQVVPQHFTIVERRAPWREESAPVWTRFPVARLRYPG